MSWTPNFKCVTIVIETFDQFDFVRIVSCLVMLFVFVFSLCARAFATKAFGFYYPSGLVLPLQDAHLEKLLLIMRSIPTILLCSNLLLSVAVYWQLPVLPEGPVPIQPLLNHSECTPFDIDE